MPQPASNERVPLTEVHRHYVCTPSPCHLFRSKATDTYVPCWTTRYSRHSFSSTSELPEHYVSRRSWEEGPSRLQASETMRLIRRGVEFFQLSRRRDPGWITDAPNVTPRREREMRLLIGGRCDLEEVLME